MGPKPEPQDLHSPEHAEWSATADRATRAAYPRYYWGHRPKGEKPKLYWDDIEVHEDEFRAGATRTDLEILGMA